MSSIWAIEQRRDLFASPFVVPGLARFDVPADIDPDCHLRHDGEWHADITLPHEVVEFEGYGVPLFEGDVERREWERQRLRQRFSILG